MSKKSRAQAKRPTKSKGLPSPLAKVQRVASGGLGSLGGAASRAVSGRGGGMRRHSKKKSIAWYAREITRMKLKRRYEKIKYKV